MTVDTSPTTPHPEVLSKKPHILSELVFAPDQIPGQEDSVILPLLNKHGIKHAISIGPGSHNMAERFEPDNIPGVIARQEAFLQKNGLEPLSKVFLGLAVPVGVFPKTLDVTEAMVTHAATRPLDRPDVESPFRAEAVFTTVPKTPIALKIGDCLAMIGVGETEEGQKVLVNAHLGRPQINERVAERTFEHLLGHYQCSPESIILGFSPAISPRHHTVRWEDQQAKNMMDLSYWGQHAWEDVNEQGERIIRVDDLSKVLSIAEQYGIKPESIEAYGNDPRVDTYDLAAKNPPEASSHRYSNATNQPERNGRIFVVAQLP